MIRLKYQSIYQLFSDRVESQPNKICLCYQTDSYTYQQLLDRIDKLAAVLTNNYGLKPNDRCCLCLENSPEFIILWLALNKIKAILVPINTQYTAVEVKRIVDQVEPKLIIYDETKFPIIKQFIKRIKCLVTLNLFAQRLTHPSIKTPPIYDYDQEDTAAIIFTSGTTSISKGVVLPNRAYLLGGEAFAFRAGLTPKDVVMTVLPLFHINAQIFSTMGSIWAGATLVIRRKFSASNFWKEACEYKVTQVNLLGVIANILLKQDSVREERQHHIRIAYGGSLNQEIVNRFLTRFKIPLLQPYSLTEACIVSSNTLKDWVPESAGKPAIFPDKNLKVEIKILDKSGRRLPPQAVGEIVIKSPVMANGYFNLPKETKNTFKRGWLYTGDYGKLDGEGRLYFVDRIKDVIRKKGENFSSREVELVLQKMPEVLEAAVIAIPSSLSDDNSKAYIVLKPHHKLSISQVKSFCRTKLAEYKVPDLIEMVTSLPKTSTQKILKNKLKTSYLLNLKQSQPYAYIYQGEFNYRLNDFKLNEPGDSNRIVTDKFFRQIKTTKITTIEAAERLPLIVKNLKDLDICLLKSKSDSLFISKLASIDNYNLPIAAIKEIINIPQKLSTAEEISMVIETVLNQANITMDDVGAIWLNLASLKMQKLISQQLHVGIKRIRCKRIGANPTNNQFEDLMSNFQLLTASNSRYGLGIIRFKAYGQMLVLENTNLNFQFLRPKR